jgi:hypothetical protein
MKFRLSFPIVLSALLVAAGSAIADEEKKGHGAGGVRAEHASEQGLDKGKAWAGSKEKKDHKEKKQKKEKKGEKGE